jgi:hypothetical protein
LLAAVVATTLVAALPATAGAADLWVGGGRTECSDALTAAEVSTSARTWCTLGRATAQARPGDTVHVLAATYGPVRFDTSGTPAAPIRVVAAEPGVTIDAAGAPQAIKLMNVSDVQLSGLRVTGAASQGVYAQGGARVGLTGLDISSNPGSGLTVNGAAQLTLQSSTVSANGSAGVRELAGTTGARYSDDVISGNGLGTDVYNGDGIQLGGTGAVVSSNTIANNGSSTYEHGIYAGASSSGWTIDRNTLADNAGANVKAAGGPGVVVRNRLTNGRYGVVLSDNPVPVDVEHNVIEGRAQHLVFLTAGATAAQARLWANTIVQSGRSTTSGDASAVFVNAATSLELRDNLLSYDGADALGVALWVNDPSRLGRLVSDTNWFTARDAQSRHLAWAGSRTTLAGWRAQSGQDPRSLSSWAPLFDAQRRVTSTNWGRGRGDNLGLGQDYAGTPLPAAGPVDIGAYQAS